MRSLAATSASAVREVLDADHYDLDKVKDRILEHLAVEKLRRERFAARRDAEMGNGGGTDGGGGGSTDKPAPAPEVVLAAEGVGREPILCFVGPPGV
jgi:ATP-dependent Lon protease